MTMIASTERILATAAGLLALLPLEVLIASGWSRRAHSGAPTLRGSRNRHVHAR